MEVDLVALITAVSGLVSAVTFLISKFYHGKKFAAIQADVAETDKWVAELEAKGTLKAGIQAVEDMSPEAKAYVDSKAEEVAKLTAELNAKKAAVEHLNSVVDAAKQALPVGAPVVSEEVKSA